MGGSRQKAARHPAGGQEGRRQKWGVVALLGLMLVGAPRVFAGEPGSAGTIAGGGGGNAAVRVTQVEGKGPRVSFHWESIGAENAFLELFRATHQPFVWAGRLEDSVPVTATMTEVDLKTAVDLICQVAGLTYEQRNGVWVISKGPETVNIGGVRYPLVGAVADSGAAWGDFIAPLTSRRVAEGMEDKELARRLGMGPNETVVRFASAVSARTVEFPGSETLVDLDVRDVPLSEVAEKLSRRLPPARLGELAGDRDRYVHYLSEGDGSLEILVDDTIGDLRVTASIRKWPLGEVLDMVVAQANLAYSSEVIPGDMPTLHETGWEEIIVHPKTTRLYLVPKPVLEVTSPTAR
ncbi:MAG: hypothetical protein ACE149_00285 [Armatimonadota bacterium]